MESASEATNLFKRLAAHLASAPAMHGGEGEVKTILEKLEYIPVDENKPAELRHRIALLEAAGRFPNLFQLAAPDAPGIFLRSDSDPPD